MPRYPVDACTPSKAKTSRVSNFWAQESTNFKDCSKRKDVWREIAKPQLPTESTPKRRFQGCHCQDEYSKQGKSSPKLQPHHVLLKWLSNIKSPTLWRFLNELVRTVRLCKYCSSTIERSAGKTGELSFGPLWSYTKRSRNLWHCLPRGILAESLRPAVLMSASQALALSSMEDTPKFSADGRQLTKGLFPPAENPRKKAWLHFLACDRWSIHEKKCLSTSLEQKLVLSSTKLELSKHNHGPR